MRRVLLALGLLCLPFWAAAQVSPIPWHPKPLPSAPKKAPGKGKVASKPSEPAKYTMTFDKMTGGCYRER